MAHWRFLTLVCLKCFFPKLQTMHGAAFGVCARYLLKWLSSSCDCGPSENANFARGPKNTTCGTTSIKCWEVLSLCWCCVLGLISLFYACLFEGFLFSFQLSVLVWVAIGGGGPGPGINHYNSVGFGKLIMYVKAKLTFFAICSSHCVCSVWRKGRFVPLLAISRYVLVLCKAQVGEPFLKTVNCKVIFAGT